jgi:hypothetical protein
VAELAGVFAASHGPLLVREWDAIPAGQQARLAAAFAELGRRISRLGPDVIVVVAPDHWSNFFLDNIPSVCIGVGGTNDGPPEPWMKGFPHRELAGHPAFAMHVAQTALESGFEPSLSHRLKLDHGFCIPLWRMGLEKLPRIVPMVVNSIEPPLPSLSRCVQWGGLLEKAIHSFAEDIRVAILATGGLSHSIGEPTMGAIDEKLDLECIRLFSSPQDQLLSYLEKELPRAGNGTGEIRNWLVAHGAAGGRGFELIDYLAVPKVIVGCGFAAWRAR